MRYNLSILLTKGGHIMASKDKDSSLFWLILINILAPPTLLTICLAAFVVITFGYYYISS